MLGNRTLLGLAIDDFGVAAAEVSVRSGRAEIRRTGLFGFDEKLTAENVRDLGRKLGRSLRENHFSCRQAFVGLPAKWIVSKEIVAPPATADALVGMLGIQAERAFSLNAGDLVFDYCGRADSSGKSNVLLIAARRQLVEQIKELVGSAGLRARCVGVSALALGKADSAGAGAQRRYGLYAQARYCEFWSQSNGRLRSVKHIPTSEKIETAAERAELVASTLQRLLLVSSEQDQLPPYQVTMYDGCGPADGIIDRLNAELGPQITVSDGAGGLLPGGRVEDAWSVAAAAVAMTGVGADKNGIDFLNPRIGRKRTSGRARVIKWAAVAGLVFVVGVAAVIADWHGKSSDVAAFRSHWQQIADDASAARDMVDRISYAGSWTSQRPEFLECLRELTLAFPESSRIWATNLGLSENAEGSLVGRAVDEQSFYEVLDKMKQNKALSGVMMMHLRNAGSDSREKEFAVTFKFKGVK